MIRVPTPYFLSAFFGELGSKILKFNMKTTRFGSYLETFLSEFKFWAEKYDIPYFSFGFEPIEEDRRINYLIDFDNHQVFKDATSAAYFAVQNNKLGYSNFVLFTRENAKDLLGVVVENPSNVFKSTISSINMFNGVPIKNIVNKESVCLIVFNY